MIVGLTFCAAHIRKTPKVVSAMGALSAAAMPSPSVRRVCFFYCPLRNRLESYAAGLERAARERDAQVMRRSMSRVMPA